jgi:hypothetical protein
MKRRVDRKGIFGDLRASHKSPLSVNQTLPSVLLEVRDDSSLRSLILEDNRITDENIEAMMWLANLQHLRLLGMTTPTQ